MRGKHRPIGSIRLLTNGYRDVKVAEPNVWRHMQVVNWEKAHGPVPKGHVVWMKDGDKSNPELSNLECITRTEAIRRMRSRFTPEELSKIASRAAKMRAYIHRMRPRFIAGKAQSGSK